MTNNWSDYQVETRDFFRSLGLDADTDVSLKGARTSHDIDVVVKLDHLGLNITWVVECKHWQTKVCKEKVLALRQIVIDVGADRGILLCEAGFQSGAIEASHLTNVLLTSLAEFQLSSREQINSLRIRDLFDRIEQCRVRYWDISKSDRIKYGIRPDVPASGYSGINVIEFVSEVLAKSFRNVYPFGCDSLSAIVLRKEQPFVSTEQVIESIEPMIDELEGKLDAYDKRKDS